MELAPRLRLQLTIQRHGIPPSCILWTSSTPALAAPHTSSGTGGTIAQFLEEVNEIFPLEEEGNWGLEDYVVEVNGFECLHFTEVGSVLRDGDSVTIRALQSTELKVRRLAGRHQVAADGRHLIDGVPFGRLRLRRTERPALSMPPRKRRRLDVPRELAYTGDDDINDDNHGGEEISVTGREVVLRKHFEDIDDDDEDDSDEDYEARGEQEDFDDEDLDDEELDGDLPSLKEELRTLRRPGTQTNSDGLNEVPGSSKTAPKSTSSGSDASHKAVRFEDKTPRTLGVNIGDMEDPDSEDDSSLHSSDFSSDSEVENDSGSGDETGSDGSDFISGVETRPHAASQSSPSDSSSSEDSDAVSPVASSEEDSSSGSDADSDSESGSDSDSGSQSDSNSSNSSSSTSSSDGGSAIESTPSPKITKTSSQPSATTSRPKPLKRSAPGQGSTATHTSNQRNKKRKRLVRLKEVGELHLDANFQDLDAWDRAHSQDTRGYSDASSKPLNDITSAAGDGSGGQDLDAAFQAKRAKLLADLALGGVDIHKTSGKENYSPEQETSVSKAVSDGLPSAENTPKTNDASAAKEVMSEPPTKRSRLNLASTKRLLFGSLGVRTPKTKEDEEQTRKKLAGKSRLSISEQVQDETHTNGVTTESAVTSRRYENWQNYLDVRAVECEVEGVEISAPPFPFVQRWDQDALATIREKSGFKRNIPNNKGKSWKHNQRTRYGGDTYRNSHAVVADVELNYDDPINEGIDEHDIGQNRIEDQHMGETTRVSPGVAPAMDDLPSIPEDLSSLPILTQADLKEDVVIIFKQLDMSSATNWQPLISSYRTAKVDKVLDDGELELFLAKRDRDPKQDQTDEETGERIYSKFEMPVDEEQDDDDGYREISFDQLIEPKILAAGPINEIKTNGDITMSSEQGDDESDDDVQEDGPEDGQSGSLDEESDSEEDDSESEEGDAESGPGEDQVVSEGDNRDRSPETNGPQTFHEASETLGQDLADTANYPELQSSIPTPRRQEISDMIADAGFRSKIDSDLVQPEGTPQKQVQSYASDEEGFVTIEDFEQSIQVSSPRFAGLGSTPPARSSADPHNINVPHTSQEFNGFSTSPAPNVEDGASVLESNSGSQGSPSAQLQSGVERTNGTSHENDSSTPLLEQKTPVLEANDTLPTTPGYPDLPSVISEAQDVELSIEDEPHFHDSNDPLLVISSEVTNEDAQVEKGVVQGVHVSSFTSVQSENNPFSLIHSSSQEPSGEDDESESESEDDNSTPKPPSGPPATQPNNNFDMYNSSDLELPTLDQIISSTAPQPRTRSIISPGRVQGHKKRVVESSPLSSPSKSTSPPPLRNKDRASRSKQVKDTTNRFNGISAGNVDIFNELEQSLPGAGPSSFPLKFEPNSQIIQIPPGTQVVDLTMSSEPEGSVYSDHDDSDDGLAAYTVRSSQRGNAAKKARGNSSRGRGRGKQSAFSHVRGKKSIV